MMLARVIFITGKGGTGKSTIAAALAAALARRSGTTLADLDQRGSAARLLGAALNGGRSANLGRRLEVDTLSARGELERFIERIVRIKAISRRMLKSATFGYVTAALPGLEAFLLLERLRILAGEAARRDRYLVIDGPATGTSLELLSVAESVKGIAPAGTLNKLADELQRFVRDPARFGALITLAPEELALREALQAASALRKLGISVVSAILNGVVTPLLKRSELEQILALGAGHLRLASRRVELAEAARLAGEQLKTAGLERIELPMLFKPVLRKAEVVELSQTLERGLDLD